jgi:hypothetical protein
MIDASYRWLETRMGYFKPLLQHAGLLIAGLLVLFLLFILLAFASGDTVSSVSQIDMVEKTAFVTMFALPWLFMGGHCVRQDRFLDRMRAAFALGAAAHLADNLAESTRQLRFIRNYERKWKFRDASAYRFALYLCITAFVACSAMTAAFLTQWRSLIEAAARKGIDKAISPVQVVVNFQEMGWWLIFPTIFVAFYTYFIVRHAVILDRNSDVYISRRWVTFYGDQLAQMQQASRSMAAASHYEEKARGAHRLPGELISARELFGLGDQFSKAQLRSAWLRLARELHPDRWFGAPEHIRQLKETALKQVNAAKDELEPYAS